MPCNPIYQYVNESEAGEALQRLSIFVNFMMKMETFLFRFLKSNLAEYTHQTFVDTERLRQICNCWHCDIEIGDAKWKTERAAP